MEHSILYLVILIYNTLRKLNNAFFLAFKYKLQVKDKMLNTNIYNGDTFNLSLPNVSCFKLQRIVSHSANVILKLAHGDFGMI